MTVGELISELQKQDKDRRVFMGYDGNIVVTEPQAVELIVEGQVGECWWRVEPGDVVILSKN